MPVREILLIGNPLLRTKCGIVKNFSAGSIASTIEDLRDTLADFRASHGFGRGIAAPQIGNSRRIIVINIDEPVTLINPVFVKRSRKMMTLWDDCFSFPDILVKVKRHINIIVRFQNGAKLTVRIHLANPSEIRPKFLDILMALSRIGICSPL